MQLRESNLAQPFEVTQNADVLTMAKEFDFHLNCERSRHCLAEERDEDFMLSIDSTLLERRVAKIV